MPHRSCARALSHAFVAVASLLLFGCGANDVPHHVGGGGGDPGYDSNHVGTSSKKGVGAWDTAAAIHNKGNVAAALSDDALNSALSDVGASWYYNWGPGPSLEYGPGSVAFVPMIWGASVVNEAALTEAKKHGDTLLGFNEPDFPAQSNMSVAQALELWPQLERTGMRLGSPATSSDPAQGGSWLAQFMDGAKSKGYRVDFICVHWYGQNFDPPSAIGTLVAFLDRVHARFGLPIWLTEYSLIGFGAHTSYPSWERQADFAHRSVEMLEALPYVERYAWFSLPQSSNDADDSTYLYRPDVSLTPTGVAFRASPSQN